MPVLRQGLHQELLSRKVFVLRLFPSFYAKRCVPGFVAASKAEYCRLARDPSSKLSPVLARVFKALGIKAFARIGCRLGNRAVIGNVAVFMVGDCNGETVPDSVKVLTSTLRL